MFYCSLMRLKKLKVMCYAQVIAPDLSWDAILNTKKVEVELIWNANMYLFFEKGMRGGVSYIFKRYSKGNNKYLKSYDPKQESKHIIYLDVINLYGILCLCSFHQADLNEHTFKNLIGIKITVLVGKVVL